MLWVEVSGQQAGAYTYLMEFRTESDLDDDVAIQHHDDVSVAIPADSVDLLRGATLEACRSSVNATRSWPAACEDQTHADRCVASAAHPAR